MKKTVLPFCSLIALLLSPISAKADGDGFYIVQYSQLPHQAGVCDVIFAGTVVSTNFNDKTPEYPYYELPAAEFAVDDVLWGTVALSNITVRSIYPADGFHFLPQERYLVCAFTNNWWANEGRFDTDYERLYHYLSITSRPPGNVVFDDYRTMCPRYTAIPFSRINQNGSNYWPRTRAFVTNLVDIARIRGDEMLMRQTLINVLDNRGANSGLPPYLLRWLWLYQTTRDDWLDGPPRPPQTPERYSPETPI